MEGPYEDYKEPDKVAAILGWLGDKGHQVYASLDWARMTRKKYKDVLDEFDSYFLAHANYYAYMVPIGQHIL